MYETTVYEALWMASILVFAISFVVTLIATLLTCFEEKPPRAGKVTLAIAVPLLLVSIAGLIWTPRVTLCEHDCRWGHQQIINPDFSPARAE